MSTSTSGTTGRRRPSRCPWQSATSSSGRIVEVGLQRGGFLPRRNGQRRRPRGVRALPQLPGGTAPPVRARQGVGVNRPGAFAEYIALPMTNVWRHHESHSPGCGGHFRSVRQRRAHRALLSGAGRGRAGHRRRADRHHGRGGGAARRRALHGDHGCEPVPAGTGAQDGRDAGGERARDQAAGRAEGAGDDRGLRRRPGDVRQLRRPSAT